MPRQLRTPPTVIPRAEIDRDTAQRQAFAPPRNQIREAASMAGEIVGTEPFARGVMALRGDYTGRPEPGRAAGEFGMAAVNLSLGALGLADDVGALRAAAPRPMRPQPTRIYRGLNQEYDADRASRLGDRWWHTNPQVASSYAPGGDGAHVIPGMIDEGSMRMARIQAPAGTMWRAVPVGSLPPELRRAFPRGTTHATTHEIAGAAESLGFDGVTFSGVRDSGFAGLSDTYPGFGTGDEGRVVALFNDRAVRSPFPAPESAPRPTPPPRQIGRASDGSVLPVREPQPIRQSFVGGSDDLMGAARLNNNNRPDPHGEGVGSDMSGRGALGQRGIRAFHGSPHDFDRFDLSRIGTGEGAQAYGHGLYFAENEGVARVYRDALSRLPVNLQDPRDIAARTLLDSFGDRQQAINLLRAEARHPPSGVPRSFMQRYRDAAALLEQDAPLPDLSGNGHMYEVNINAAPEEFLDWDAPQPNHQRLSGAINSAIRNYGDPRLDAEEIAALQNPAALSGEDIYRRLSLLGGQSGATSELRSAGIPGIRYLDQGSRAAGEGSRNYVVFDDSLIEILRKYGLAGLAYAGAGGAATGALSQGRSQ